MADTQYKPLGTESTPADWVVPGALDLLLKSIYAEYDGTSAGSSYVPTVELLDDAGRTVGAWPYSSSVAAGASADVTWFPGVVAAAATATVTPVASGNTTTVQTVAAGGNLTIAWDTVNTVGTGWSWTSGDPTKVYYAGSGTFATQVIVSPDTDWPATGTGQIAIGAGVTDSGTNYFNIAGLPEAEHPAIDLYSPASTAQYMFRWAVSVGADASPNATCYFDAVLSNTTSSPWSLFDAEFVVWRISDFVSAF